MNISKIVTNISSGINKVATKTSEIVQKHPKISKAIDKFEPSGGDNSFFGLAMIMGAFVLLPRLKTALKRNPDNKEATKDELTEIFLRDAQTILIMLFGLKTMNSVVANIGTKLSGIPMVDVPFKKLFNKNTKGFANKVSEFVQHPIEKTKIIGSNILKALNPIGGSSSLAGKKISSLYANYASAEEVKKFLDDVPNHGGDKQKVFDKIKKNISKRLDDKIAIRKSGSPYNVNTGLYSAGVQKDIESLHKTKEYFEKLKLEDFMSKDFKMEKGHEKELIDFFADNKNPLALTANRVNDWLKMLALGIELSYLGFGMPAINQRRLEKKYLQNSAHKHQDSFNPITDRHIKAQEIKLYSQFIK